MTDWKDKVSFMAPDAAAEEVEIGGKTIKVYPVSMGTMFKLRVVAQPLASSLMTLMTNTDNDSSVHRVINEEGLAEESIMAPTPELVEARVRHQDEALKGLLDAFTSPANLGVFGDILIDSLRDIFDPGDSNNPPGIEFINSIGANHVPALVKAVLAANKGTIGEALGKNAGLLKAVLGKVKDKAEKYANETPNTKIEEGNENPNEAGSSSSMNVPDSSNEGTD